MSNPKPRTIAAPDGRMPPKTARGPAPGSRTKSFLRWLRAKTPASLRLETDEDGERTLKIKLTDNPKAIEQTVLAYEPSRCEAFDEHGNALGLWTFAEPEDDASALPASIHPAFVKSEGDSDSTGVLKAFGAMIAEAHKAALQGLVGVVNLQSQHFAEERKAMSAALMNMDRIVQKAERLARATPRFRVAEDGGEGEETEPAENDDTAFVTELVKAALRKQEPAPAPSATNGAAATGGASS